MLFVGLECLVSILPSRPRRALDTAHARDVGLTRDRDGHSEAPVPTSTYTTHIHTLVRLRIHKGMGGRESKSHHTRRVGEAASAHVEHSIGAVAVIARARFARVSRALSRDLLRSRLFPPSHRQSHSLCSRQPRISPAARVISNAVSRENLPSTPAPSENPRISVAAER